MPDRICLVTGGARGLGRMLVEGLLADGWSVAYTSRDQGRLDTSIDELGHDRARGYVCDVCDPESTKRLWKALREDWESTPELLVNNAGATWGEPAEVMSLDGWERCLRANLTGTFLMCQEAARLHLEGGARDLSIVNVSSIAALRVNPAMQIAGYAASKAAVLGLTRQLAFEWAPHGIRVNAVLPGTFPTRMTKAYLDGHADTVLQGIPLGRLGEPGDFVHAVEYLADARFVTGQQLVIDGGESLS